MASPDQLLEIEPGRAPGGTTHRRRFGGIRQFLNIKQSALLMVALGVAAVAQGETKITGGRFWHGPEKTRMVFDISAATTFQAFVLTSPDRFVIDIDNTILDGGLPEPQGDTSPVTDVRTGQPQAGVLRVVLDLARPVKYQVFVLEPNLSYPY